MCETRKRKNQKTENLVAGADAWDQNNKGGKTGKFNARRSPSFLCIQYKFISVAFVLASSLAVGYVTYTDELDFTSCDKTHSVVVVLLLALILACC
jgi:hypothetical protein